MIPDWAIAIPHLQCDECFQIQEVGTIVGKSVDGKMVIESKQTHSPTCSRFPEQGKKFIVVYDKR